MNKDVIYIEPEDDITDILANIKGAKNRVVALVPPKKAGVLRSAVNFKLIAKTATRADKVVVLISNDESLVKLAAAAAKEVMDCPHYSLASDYRMLFAQDDADPKEYILAIKNDLKVPVKFIGVGEGIDDLRPFNPHAFAEGLFENEVKHDDDNMFIPKTESEEVTE